VIDKNLAAAESLARQCGAPHALTNVEEIRRLHEANAVYVATWPPLHCEHVILAAEAGKHVLCEKPLAPVLPECDRMIQACRQANVRLMVATTCGFTLPTSGSGSLW